MRDPRRAESQLPASDDGLLNGQGDEQVRFTDVIVIEKVVGAGFEVIGIDRPAVERDGHAELVFFVAFSEQGQEAKVVGSHELQQRTRRREQWRRLVVVSVEGTEHPVKARKRQGRSKAGADGVFRDDSGEMGGAHAGNQSEPRGDLKLVVDKEGR